MYGIQDKVVVLTGAAGGLGEAVAAEALRHGARVALLDIAAQRLHALAGALERVGPVRAWPVDVAAFAAVAAAAAEIEHTLGPIDVWVNNAGILQDAFVTDISDDDWDRMLAVNLKGAFNGIKAVLPGMMQRRSGSIVNIASMGGKSSWPLTGAHYCAAKAGLIGLSKQVAKQVAPHGIRVNAVAPGTAETPMIRERGPEKMQWISRRIPLGRLASPADVAAAVLFLAGDAAAYITGYTLDVNGGAYVD